MGLHGPFHGAEQNMCQLERRLSTLAVLLVLDDVLVPRSAGEPAGYNASGVQGHRDISQSRLAPAESLNAFHDLPVC